MLLRFHASRALPAALTLTTLAALTACGGGGGGSAATATVSSMSVTATRYGTPALVTIAGTGLGNLSVTSTGCKNMKRLTASPTASTDTTAYYSCTPSGAYSSDVLAVSNGSTVYTQNFRVPAPVVTMSVSGGGVNANIVFNLKGDTAPITVDNFLAYVNAGFYDGLIIHRIAHATSTPPYFIVQGGGYGAATSGTLPSPKAPLFDPIALETGGGANVQWTAAMARTNDPNSATSQFFFNVIDDSVAFGTSYAVFADVSASASVITQITQASCTPLVGTGLNDGSCVPIPNVVVTSASQTQ